MTTKRGILEEGLAPRRFVPPLGWPPRPRLVVCKAADRPPLLFLNHYPRQVIGFGVRLRGHRYLSVLWSKPARWWRESDLVDGDPNQ